MKKNIDTTPKPKPAASFRPNLTSKGADNAALSKRVESLEQRVDLLTRQLNLLPRTLDEK